jgi:tetratricopeptide (TPR) repeat protein
MKTALAILSFGLLSLTSLSNATGQDDATEKARASFYEGVELFKEGSFEAALAEFQRANQISPSYRVLYNIAQAYVELHDYVNAYTTLKDYVQHGGDELSAARRTQVDELNRKLEKRIAYLEIICNLDDADIRVDDISVGTSPLAFPVLVNAGPRRLSAVKPGYPVAARILTVAGTDRSKVTLEIVTPLEVQPSKLATAPTATPALAKPASPRLREAEPPTLASRRWLIVSLSMAGGCAVATGISGWQMLAAKNDFDSEVAKTPYSKPVAESARSRAMTYQSLTYGFGAATLAAGGVALYLALTGDGDSGQRNRSTAQHSIAVVPAPNGLLLHGVW